MMAFLGFIVSLALVAIIIIADLLPELDPMIVGGLGVLVASVLGVLFLRIAMALGR